MNGPRHALHCRTYANRLRTELFELLGNRCAACGRTWDDGVELEPNHLHGRDWSPRAMNRWRRAKRYLEEARRGLIQLLCRSCNAADGQRFRGRSHAK